MTFTCKNYVSWVMWSQNMFLTFKYGHGRFLLLRPNSHRVLKLHSNLTPRSSLSRNSNGRPASKEISHLLWNPEVHYHIHKSSPLVHVVRRLNAIHTHRIWLRTIFILSSYLDLPSGLPSSGFPTKMCAYLMSPVCAAWPACLIPLDFIP
jgi:hypothetical protein